MPSLTGHHAVVTGAAQGIGAAIARALAAQGARLTLMGRRLDALQALAAELPGGAVAVSVDVSDEGAVQRAFVAARAAHGPISLLVNNAGQAEAAPFGKTSLALWQRLIAVNLTGTFLCTQQALPDMLAARHGRVVNIASTAGQRGYAYVSAYVAAKHGLIGLAKVVAKEGAAHGVRSNVICPGFVRTPLVEKQIPEQAAALGLTDEQVIKTVMLKETVDGEFQKYAATDGAFNRENFFNRYPELRQLVAHLTDADIDRLVSALSEIWSQCELARRAVAA
jgi:NAD(P)-dependent dehydrogenase (short-subunit alcohol dehydrogenase family)